MDRARGARAQPVARAAGTRSFIVRHARRVVAISDAVVACFPEARAASSRVYNAVDLAEFSARPAPTLASRAVSA